MTTCGQKIFASVSVMALAVTAGCGKTHGANDFDLSGPPGLAEIGNATFSGIGDQPVRLEGGLWEGKPYVKGGASRPSVGLVDHFILHGDINGDEVEESAVLLWESSGGSGTRSHLAVMGRSGKRITNLGTAVVGDRVQVISGWIIDNEVALDLVRAGPDDAACCPTERAVVSWALTTDGLARTAEQVVGTFSITDLEGPEWTLAEIGRGGPVPDGISITLTFQGDRVAGSGGCNRYFGTVTSTTPGELAFSAMGTTQMACPDPAMGAERKYLRSLARASSYSFVGGRLLLGCDTDDGPVALVFNPPRPEEEILVEGP